MQSLRCPDVSVLWRRIIAASVFLYTRPGELRGLSWEVVDLEYGVLRIRRAAKRGTRMGEELKLKAPKTKRGRTVPLEPNLMPLPYAVHRESGGQGSVFVVPDDRHLSRSLRRFMQAAKLTRPELFASEHTTKAMTYYDLRATGATWRAIRGDDLLKIMQAAGHERFDTTMRYVREAEALRRGFGDVFPPLPEELLRDPLSSSDEVVSPEILPEVPQVREMMVEALGIERNRGRLGNLKRNATLAGKWLRSLLKFDPAPSHLVPSCTPLGCTVAAT